MVEHHHKEAARTTSWVEYTAILVRIEHLNHTLDDVARGEELTCFLLQGIADNRFVCSTLYINSCIEEWVLCKFTCNEGKTTVREHNLLIAIKNILEYIAFLQVLKDSLNTFSNSCLSFLGVLFLYTHPETTTITDSLLGIRESALLIIELTEDEVEKFPEGSLLHALISVDVIMATLEGLYQRFISWLTRHSTFTLCFEVFECLTTSREVRDSFASNLSKAILIRIDILEIFSIGPASKLTVSWNKNIFCCCFNSCFLVIWFDLGIFGYDDEADELVCVVSLSFVEDSKIHLLSLGCSAINVFILDLEITLHIFRSETILFSHHCNHRLQCHFFFSSFYYFVS